VISKRLRVLITKELRQTLRDRRMLPILFIMPIIQMVLLGYAATTDIVNTTMMIVDEDHSVYSRKLIHQMATGDYFNIRGVWYNQHDGYVHFIRDRGVLLLTIPPNFEKSILKQQPVSLSLVSDGTDTLSSTISSSYVMSITQQLNANQMKSNLTIDERFLYNPNLKSVVYMVPGVLVLIISLITMLLPSMAITKEREIGTFEQLIVSPIHANELILGKALPFILLGCINSSLVLAFGILVFHVPFLGSFPLLVLAMMLYIFVCIGIGILISVFSSTQQQAMLTFFFYMIPASIISGFMFPIENMPTVFKWASLVNPMRYILECVRGIMLKGNTFAIIWPWLLGLALFAIASLSIGIIKFRNKWI